jgi:hypothetical protein
MNDEFVFEKERVNKIFYGELLCISIITLNLAHCFMTPPMEIIWFKSMGSLNNTSVVLSLCYNRVITYQSEI